MITASKKEIYCDFLKMSHGKGENMKYIARIGAYFMTSKYE
jgi:hypothetical protein